MRVDWCVSSWFRIKNTHSHRDLARVGWRGLAPFLPIGPRERPRLADSFFAPGSGARGIPRVARPAIRRVAAMRRKERGPRGTPRPAPSEGGRELRGPHGRLSSALPRGGGEQGGGGIRAVGRGLGFMWLRLAFRGGASVQASAVARAQRLPLLPRGSE